jgi:hypothetical protein
MTTHSIVTSLVARYLSNPGFRDQIATGRKEALASCGLSQSLNLEFHAVDFRALEGFGGLITKTQHNFLYEDLPYTRHLMRTYGLDLTVFTDYRSQVQSRQSVAVSRAEKTARFVSYLMAWLNSRGQIAPGLADVLKHEFILYELKGEAARIVGEMGYYADVARNLPNLALRPGVRLAEFQRDPLRIIARIQAGEAFTLGRRRRCCLVYQIEDEQIKTFRPTRTVWHVLSMIDGQRSLGMIHRALRPLSRSTVQEVLFLLRGSGLLIGIGASR